MSDNNEKKEAIKTTGLVFHPSDEKLIEKVNSLLQSDSLTGMAMSRSCTDGFDVHYVLLSVELINLVRNHKKE